MSDYTTEKLDKKQYLSDKKQFLLDMLIISEEQNFEIGRRLKDQAEYLESLWKIAWEVGHIKQDARADVFKLAEKMGIPMDINKRPREVYMLYFGDESKRGIENETKETTSSVTPQEPTLNELRAEITTLQNRCYALTKGTMCAFCRYECEYKAETENT